MLALLIGLLAAAGLLARGAWDVWAQSPLFIAAVVGTAVWLLGRIVVGYVPVPPRKLLAWAAALAALSLLSALASPVQAHAVPAWRALALGLWVFLATAVASKDERARVDLAVRAAAWAMVLLAFYQYYHDGIDRPPASLLNQNVFAGAVLMLLPLAAEQRDWILCGALLVCLWWCRSLGAWLGLSAALLLTRKGRETLGSYAGMALLFCCSVVIYGKLQSPEVHNRWHWWAAAWRMAQEHPLLGLGTGSYAFAAPSYFGDRPPLSTLFAHQHLLETAAERGWLFMFLWTGGLVYFLRRGAPHKRFGAIGVLVQSLWDYPLSIPGVYWLFCYYSASTIPQTSVGINVKLSRKAPWALAVALAAGGAVWWAARDWRADLLKAGAIERARDQGPDDAAIGGLRASLALSPDAEAERALAELLLNPARKPSRETAAEAAAHLERAARLNPYRPSTWAALERLHLALGDPERARALRAEGERWCPALKTQAAVR